jgi:hypothetical protein
LRFTKNCTLRDPTVLGFGFYTNGQTEGRCSVYNFEKDNINPLSIGYGQVQSYATRGDNLVAGEFLFYFFVKGEFHWKRHLYIRERSRILLYYSN